MRKYFRGGGHNGVWIMGAGCQAKHSIKWSVSWAERRWMGIGRWEGSMEWGGW